jgi:hypothetical protein
MLSRCHRAIRASPVILIEWNLDGSWRICRNWYVVDILQYYVISADFHIRISCWSRIKSWKVLNGELQMTSVARHLIAEELCRK